MKLFLVRHAESELNAKKLSGGTTDCHLTKKGKEQAEKIAQRLRYEEIDCIYSSDLIRCIDTARAIGRYHKDKLICLYGALREQNKTTWEGKSKEYIEKELNKLQIPYYLFQPKNGESLIEVYPRVIQFLTRLKSKHEDENVLLVTHGGPIVCLLVHLLDEPFAHYQHYLPKINTSLSIIDFKNNKKNIINSTEHLNKMKYG